MSTSAPTLLKNPIIAKRNKPVFQDYPFEQGQLYYDIPQPASKLEKSIFWLIISIGIFLFWKNVFQTMGVI